MNNNIALKAAGMVFLLISLMHLLRVIFKIQIIVAGLVMPVWISALGFLFGLALSLWMFKSVK